MTAFDHRLRDVMRDLSARERALLALRLWVAGEPFDQELIRSMPHDQREEYDRLVLRYEDANQQVGGYEAMWQQWIAETEVFVLWLHSLKAWEEREQVYTACLAEQGVTVRSKGSRRTKGEELVLGLGPVCPWGLMKGITQLWGTRPADRGEGRAPRLLELSAAVADSVRGGIELRWQEQRAIEIVFAELSTEYDGEETLHPDLRRAVNECKAKLAEMRESVLPWCGPFKLPEPDEELPHGRAGARLPGAAGGALEGGGAVMRTRLGTGGLCGLRSRAAADGRGLVFHEPTVGW